ncbi:hypothetical protein PQR70_17440 [Paraburkholderia madseniana]|uniref:Uncharacterized protein n=1 Tax=Paraburkholderia madseniana TaxID=2599607 RepID=A0A6N6W495_9BURK|nr:MULTISPECIES: hypothetical protein [Paraburkholderia]KAE8755462.1 hypothetical protein FSO04_34210 [Paraburkholderia madseniana]MCX4148769.1 hypothetical protein [Paraburkholderia madseniana]MDN7151707.1 hypothetical protein [Paraburkholderia sp. WS6]MDQ6410587.1 hypothetical protein [Paraburkholderia madseniana]NPT69579.1 hypothetical protein [Paraburkholderia madseniana]
MSSEAAEQAEELSAWASLWPVECTGAGLFLLLPYQANGERVGRAQCLYDARLDPAEAAHSRVGVQH